ncbi:MAG: NADH-quinone oxidoreductase subunit L [Phycisphaerales bacterium]|nr:NADH-quinone oxidoreductase subunit L [Phycisphaerales bacterium]
MTEAVQLSLGSGWLAAVDAARSVIAGPSWAGWILWLPLISLVLCGVCAALKIHTKLPAWITVGSLAISFVVTVALYMSYRQPMEIPLLDWFNLNWRSNDGQAGSFVAGFAFYVDKLTLLWMLFVTGLGTLIALYASEYMEPDVKRGYARFFAGISVFLFAMSCLVLADNLVMLYLGWEGVGFASYWLIGYYYTRPSAVAAAKKAFIVNRIGDLGLALGIWLIYYNFGTVEYANAQGTGLFQILASGSYKHEAGGWSIQAIPFLLMLGAFGKSAQIPLYVWLPDAMEGPTPVSALIHAATMVTAGVYLLARMLPVMELHPAALPTVAWIGGLTALLAATIGMAQYDIKRIWAYSTVSQLGFMFVGVGVLTTYGAAFHVFTHAFFKAVLFLTGGAVMHGFAGQLDIRKISGLRHMPGWQITAWTMLVGCLCLAGFPLSSGFFSKDEILAQVFAVHRPWLGFMLLFTALLTAYYTFRVWFRVCAGPVSYEMGEEHHGHGDDHHHGKADTGHKAPPRHAPPAHVAHQPHPPRFAINFVLVVITVGAIISTFSGSWVMDKVSHSSAAVLHAADSHEHHPGWVPWLAGTIAVAGIVVAWHFHLASRKSADALRARLLANPLTRWLPTAMENKWYVDEFYEWMIVTPLWIFAHALYLFDRYVIDLLFVDGVARLPKWMGRSFQPLQNGVLQSYAVLMAGGVGLAILLVVVLMPHLRPWLIGFFGGGG